MSTVIPTDLEAWACDYIRDALEDVKDLQVTTGEPPNYPGATRVTVLG